MVDSTLLVVGGVLLIIVAVLMTSNKMAGRTTMPGDAADEADGGEDLLLKFVHHEGAVVGETVAVEGASVILKQAGQFKSVPRDRLKGEEGGLLLTGEMDWDESLAAGAAWHERNTKGVDPQVTSHLTRSEDVVAPALAAFKEREGESDSSEE